MSRRDRLCLDRRALLRGAALGAGALALPRAARALAGSTERRFLFLYVYGGWDVSYGLTYLGDHPVYDADPSGAPAEAGGVPFCDSEARPSVRAFFEQWGSSVALLHGLQVPSVTHEGCARLLFTGASSERDDVPLLLASRSTTDPLLPYALLSGPAYFDAYGGLIARLGTDGLATLLDGRALTLSDRPVDLPEADADALTDAVVRGRAEAMAATAGRGRPRVFHQRYAEVLDQLALLEQQSGALELGGFSFDEQLQSALSVLESGVSRVATVMHAPTDSSWDTHSDNSAQEMLFERLFGSLVDLMLDLSTRAGPSGGALLDELTIVVASEMGRYPLLNTDAGKHHWPYTSAMLLGAGVRGGQSIGGYSDTVEGLPVDLATGELHDGGARLNAASLAATLLALGDVDPAEHFDGVELIGAVIDD